MENIINFLSKEKATELIKTSKNNKRNNLIILLMLDAGFRISETVNLKFQNLNFKKKEITIASLKKRKKQKKRIVPISGRLYSAFSNYLDSVKISMTPADFIFPSTAKEKHINRRTVNKFLKKYGININVPELHPHMLRHTFATHHLNEGSSLMEIKTMLGHERYDTTAIYTHIPTDKLHDRVNAITSPPPTFWEKLKKRLFTKKRKTINLDFRSNYTTVGRSEILENLHNLFNQNQNVILKGSVGTGKSHILEILNYEDTIIFRLADCTGFKKSLEEILKQLLLKFKDANQKLINYHNNLLTEELEIDNIKIGTNTISGLIEKINFILKDKKALLIIDDITRITSSGKNYVEKLKSSFIIFAGARFVKANDSSFAWNFKIIEIKNLNKNNSFQLIKQVTNFDVQNFELYQNHIFAQSGGNPRAIFELIQELANEPILTEEIILSKKHIGAKSEIDMSWVIAVFFGCIMSLRYLAGELDEKGLKFIGGVGMILLLFYRPILSSFKRRFL